MPLLLADSYSDLALPPRYWQELVNLLKEEDALAEIINPLLKALSQNCLKTQALDKNYINHFRVCFILLTLFNQGDSGVE